MDDRILEAAHEAFDYPQGTFEVTDIIEDGLIRHLHDGFDSYTLTTKEKANELGREAVRIGLYTLSTRYLVSFMDDKMDVSMVELLQGHKRSSSILLSLIESNGKLDVFIDDCLARYSLGFWLSSLSEYREFEVEGRSYSIWFAGLF